MNESKFKQIYKQLKSIIEEIDPVGFGAIGEYDDVLFVIIKDCQNMNNKAEFARNFARIIAEAFDLKIEALMKLSDDFSEKVYAIYPQGLGAVTRGDEIQSINYLE